MIKRCENTRSAKYPRYGGRGITVCDRWRRNFAAFAEDMGPRPSPEHSIDRIDNDGHYEPGNCRWATRSEQYWNSSCVRPGHLPCSQKLIRSLRARGAKCSVLAAAFGVSRSFVTRVCKEAA